MTRILPTAWLRPDSPFAAVFPDGCPVQGPVEELGRFAGDEEGFYRCNYGRCTPDQRERVALLVAETCRVTKAEVLAHWKADGFLPLRARHVAGVSFDGRFLL